MGRTIERDTILCGVARLAENDNLKSEIANPKPLAESISRQLRGWAAALQNSPIRGPRHLTEKTRTREREERQHQELEAYLQEVIRQGREPAARGIPV